VGTENHDPLLPKGENLNEDPPEVARPEDDSDTENLKYVVSFK
jgi:hypothetical protein